MASFQTQVMGLTGINISSSGTNPTEAQLTQFLTDGAQEIINQMPKRLLPLCAAEQSFTSGSPQTLNTGNILYVTRSDGTIAQPCRKINGQLVGRSLDSGDMNAATTTDPIYYIKNNTIDVAPSSGSSVYSEVQYPAVVYSASNVSVFPDEAEYLIPLYASVKSLQNALSAKSGNTDITAAFVLLKAAVDQAETAADKFELANEESVFGDEDTFLTTSSQLTRVKAALDEAEDIINANEPTSSTDAYGAQANEDVELVTSALSIAQTEIRRAQAHIQEWEAIGDMRVKEVNAALSEADGYAKEIQSRLAVISTEYAWMEKQQAKLQADYDKGLQALK